MAAGYALGRVYTFEASRRQRWLIRMGIGLVAGFVLLRATNLYGDPNEWSMQRNALMTVLSFIKVTKYPASLAVCDDDARSGADCARVVRAPRTIERDERDRTRRAGAAVLLSLAMAAGAPRGLLPSAVFGRDTAHFFMNPTALLTAPPVTNSGFDLPVVYLCWAAVLAC
jgi:hypothetical protein